MSRIDSFLLSRVDLSQEFNWQFIIAPPPLSLGFDFIFGNLLRARVIMFNKNLTYLPQKLLALM